MSKAQHSLESIASMIDDQRARVKWDKGPIIVAVYFTRKPHALTPEERKRKMGIRSSNLKCAEREKNSSFKIYNISAKILGRIYFMLYPLNLSKSKKIYFRISLWVSA